MDICHLKLFPEQSPRPICRNVSEDFCCINFGGFSRGFSWRIFLGTFSHKKMRRKNPATKSAQKSGGSKIKIREKSVLPKAGPKNKFCHAILTLRRPDFESQLPRHTVPLCNHSGQVASILLFQAILWMTIALKCRATNRCQVVREWVVLADVPLPMIIL